MTDNSIFGQQEQKIAALEREIAALHAELDRMREALKKIVDLNHYPDESIARHALGIVDEQTTE